MYGKYCAFQAFSKSRSNFVKIHCFSGKLRFLWIGVGSGVWWLGWVFGG